MLPSFGTWQVSSNPSSSLFLISYSRVTIVTILLDSYANLRGRASKTFHQESLGCIVHSHVTTTLLPASIVLVKMLHSDTKLILS